MQRAQSKGALAPSNAIISPAPQPQSGLTQSDGSPNMVSLQSTEAREPHLSPAPALAPGEVKRLGLSGMAAKKPTEDELLAALAAPKRNFREQLSSAEALIKHYPTPVNVAGVLMHFARKPKARTALLSHLTPQDKLKGIQLALRTLMEADDPVRGPKIHSLMRALGTPLRNALVFGWQLDFKGQKSPIAMLGEHRAMSKARASFLGNLMIALMTGEQLNAASQDLLLAVGAYPELLSEKARHSLGSTLRIDAPTPNPGLVALRERFWQVAHEAVWRTPSEGPNVLELNGPELDHCADLLGLRRPHNFVSMSPYQFPMELQKAIDAQDAQTKDASWLMHMFSCSVSFSDLVALNLPAIKEAQKTLPRDEAIHVLVHTLATMPNPHPLASHLVSQRMLHLEKTVLDLRFRRSTSSEFNSAAPSMLQDLIHKAFVESRSEPGSAQQDAAFVERLKEDLEAFMQIEEKGGLDDRGVQRSPANDLRMAQVLAEIQAIDRAIKAAES